MHKFQESEVDFKNLKRLFNKLNLAVFIFYPSQGFSLKIVLPNCSPLTPVKTEFAKQMKIILKHVGITRVQTVIHINL